MHIQLSILTPEGPVREAVHTLGVEVPGLLGEVGILPGHEPFVTALRAGVVRFRESDSSTRIAVGSGVCEVQRSSSTDVTEVTILVERAAEPDKISPSVVKEALQVVATRLKASSISSDNSEVAALLDEQAFLEAQLRAAAS